MPQLGAPGLPLRRLQRWLLAGRGAGLASFALGTDTAGSGRVPAALNNLVGLKASKGLISTAGVVPACRTLDCVTFFTATAAEASQLLALTARLDPRDEYSRSNPLWNDGSAFGQIKTFRFGIPQQLEFRLRRKPGVVRRHNRASESPRRRAGGD